MFGRFMVSLIQVILEALTHSETPWLAAREGLDVDEISENEISIDSIKKYYSAKLNK